jgi:hypothetical protein
MNEKKQPEPQPQLASQPIAQPASKPKAKLTLVSSTTPTKKTKKELAHFLQLAVANQTFCPALSDE